MNSWITLWNHAAEMWAAAMWRACWQGGLAVLIVWAVCRVFSSIRSSWRVWLWRLACLKFLVALFCPTAIDLPLLSPATPAGSMLRETQHDTPRVEIQSTILVDAPRAEIMPEVRAWLFLLWTAGVVIGSARFVGQHYKARELRRNASPIAEVRVDQQCQELAHLFGFERHPELFQSRQIARPGLMGIVRPAILLPPDTGNRFSTDDLRMILAHEMAHQKRLDLLWMKLLLACEVLFFVHPLLWLARREWLLAQEIACDEIALRITSAPPSTYGAMLLELITATSLKPGAAGFLSIIETKETLQRRVVAMKQTRSASVKKTVAFTLIVLLAATIGIVPWRVVAQNNPQQEELARLKEENSKLREELNQTRTQIADLDRQKLIAAQTQLEARAEQLQEQLQELLVKYKDVHPMVQKTQAQLEVIQEQLAKIAEENKRLGRLSNQKSLLLPSGGSRQLMVTNLHGTNLNFIRRTERELLLAELKLAEEQHAITIKRFEIGKSVPDEVLRAQREVFDIRRELARFDQNRNALRNLLEEQMKLAQTWLETTRKCIEIGTLPAGSDIIFQKELLKIQRELLGQK